MIALSRFVPPQHPFSQWWCRVERKPNGCRAMCWCKLSSGVGFSIKVVGHYKGNALLIKWHSKGQGSYGGHIPTGAICTHVRYGTSEHPKVPPSSWVPPNLQRPDLACTESPRTILVCSKGNSDSGQWYPTLWPSGWYVTHIAFKSWTWAIVPP